MCKNTDNKIDTANTYMYFRYWMDVTSIYIYIKII